MPDGMVASPFDGISTGDASFVVDEDSRVIRWSDRAAEVFGFSEADALGKRCYEIVNGADARNPVSCGPDCPVLTVKRRNPRIPDFDVLGRCADGSYKWLNVTTLISAGPRGRGDKRGGRGHRQVMHLVRDVTGNRSIEEFARISANAIRSSGTGSSTPTTVGEPAVTRESDSTCVTPRLSRREHQVLRLLSHGATTQEIANSLGVAHVTARNHVSRLLTRLGVGTRLQAVVYGARAGLI